MGRVVVIYATGPVLVFDLLDLLEAFDPLDRNAAPDARLTQRRVGAVLHARFAHQQPL